jgi:hypothetical protein
VRAAFIQRFWPVKSPDPEAFAVTLNIAAAPAAERLIESIMAMVPAVQRGRRIFPG